MRDAERFAFVGTPLLMVIGIGAGQSRAQCVSPAASRGRERSPWKSLLLPLVFFAAVLVNSSIPVSADLLVGSSGGEGIGKDSILRFDETTAAFICKFVSSGSGGLDNPLGMTIGPDGNLYVSSRFTVNILRYNGTTGAFIDVFAAGSGLFRPHGLAFGPDGNLYVSSSGGHDVLRFNGTTGLFIDTFASGGGLSFPTALIFGSDGNLYVSSSFNNLVLRYDGTTGAFIDTFASGGGLSNAQGLDFGPDGNLYVGSFNGDSVLRYDGTTGAFIDVFVSAGSGGLNAPNDVEFGPDGNLYVQSSQSARVVRYDGTTGAFIDTFVGGGLSGQGYLLFTQAPAPLCAGVELQVEGAIESTSGGFKFPDGSVQITAHTGASPLEAAAADSDEVGSRVLDACAVGWSIGSINADGTVVCEAIDADIADHAAVAEVHHARNPDPPCFNMTRRFVDCRNGTVTDTVTGLIYLKSADCFETQTWSEANQSATTLAAGQCGLTDGSVVGDWRLQTKEEWEAVLDPSCPTAPKIAGDGVRGTCYTDSSWASGLASASYWSSGTDIDSPGNAWKPNLNSGIVEHDSKTSHNHVWPVRGGQ